MVTRIFVACLLVCIVLVCWSCTSVPLDSLIDGAKASESGVTRTEVLLDAAVEPTAEPAVEPLVGDESVLEAPADGGEPEVTPEAVGPEVTWNEAVDAPVRKWHWVDVPESKCGYGSPTGFALNKFPGAKLLYIYLQGGGACWNKKEAVGGCFSLVPTSLNLDGFSKRKFERDPFTQQNINSFFFKRDDAENALAKAHYVFVPYCTGDVFSGNATLKSGDKTMHFHGHNNMKAFLSRIVPTFAGVERVIVAGSSAGGFGASLNWGLVQKYFGDKVRVDLLNDSGPPIDPVEGRWEEWVKAWGLAPPPGCLTCLNGVASLLDHYRNTMLAKGRKMALLTYERDSVIRTFFGISDLTGSTFKKRITSLFDLMDKIPEAHYYALSGSSHTMMMLLPSRVIYRDKIPLKSWIKWFVDDSPAWISQRP